MSNRYFIYIEKSRGHWVEFRFHPPTQETTALAVEECVTSGGIASAMHPYASADFADWRMTHRSLGACAPKGFTAQGRRWVGLLGTTGLPVGLHGSCLHGDVRFACLRDLPMPAEAGASRRREPLRRRQGTQAWPWGTAFRPRGSINPVCV